MKRGGGDGRGEVETEDKRWADQFGLMCLRQSCAQVFFNASCCFTNVSCVSVVFLNLFQALSPFRVMRLLNIIKKI